LSTASNRDFDDVFPVVYEELRRVAHRHLRGELTGHTRIPRLKNIDGTPKA